MVGLFDSVVNLFTAPPVRDRVYTRSNEPSRRLEQSSVTRNSRGREYAPVSPAGTTRTISDLDRRLRAEEERRQQVECTVHFFQQSLVEEQRRTSAFSTDCENARAQINRMGAALQQKEELLQTMQQQLQQSQAELRSANTYLDQADACSETDVRQLVEELNGECMQSAAIIADFAPKRRSLQKSVEWKSAIDFVVRKLGNEMGEILARLDHHEDPLIVQIALQGVLIARAAKMSTVWGKGTQLQDVYDAMKTVESRAVSGRWRAIALKHIHCLDEAASSVVEELACDLAAVLVVAGFVAKRSQGQEMVVREVGQRLEAIVELVTRLNNAMGQDITSFELSCFRPHSGDPFEPDTMKNPYGSILPAGSTPRRVLCTSEMGLERRQVQPDAGHVRVILLKSGVALDTICEEMGIAMVVDDRE